MSSPISVQTRQNSPEPRGGDGRRLTADGGEEPGRVLGGVKTSVGTTSLFKQQQPLSSAVRAQDSKSSRWRKKGPDGRRNSSSSPLRRFRFSLFSFLLLLLLREALHKYVVTRGSNPRKEANFLPVSSLSCAVIEGEEAGKNY